MRRLQVNDERRMKDVGLTVHRSSFIVHRSDWRKVRESNPQERVAPTVFGTAWRARAQPSEVHQVGLEPTCSRGATALQAAAWPIRRLMQKLMKAGERETPRLHPSR